MPKVKQGFCFTAKITTLWFVIFYVLATNKNDLNMHKFPTVLQLTGLALTSFRTNVILS